jgi:hypothetical protein
MPIRLPIPRLRGDAAGRRGGALLPMGDVAGDLPADGAAADPKPPPPAPASPGAVPEDAPADLGRIAPGGLG